ncbi:MAG: hypothetical protein KGS72_11530 [Cyanobacteria bacterium REEB67]|nr:hypothetical protein [Cyanobacteria bacterium REEB67]
MISFNLNGVPTLFIKGFTSADVELMLNFVRGAASAKRARSGPEPDTVLFIDTPITAPTVEAVHRLKHEGFRVVFRDHHGIDGKPVNDRDQQVELATQRLRKLLQEDCLITVRRLHPACSTLVEIGEFAGATAIIADPDPDGLTASMKAVGIYYPGLDEDAALLDGEPASQVTGTRMSSLLAKGVTILPSFDSKFPERREKALEDLFKRWVKAVQGDGQALRSLEEGEGAYDRAVKEAEGLAQNAREVAPGVVLVDTVDANLYDVGTLLAALERLPGCRITVLRKGLGPIAAVHGVQYSMAVAKAAQDEINLQLLLPQDVKSDPKQGIISNVSFLLHVSEYVWQDVILPQLNK